MWTDEAGSFEGIVKKFAEAEPFAENRYFL